MLYEVITDVLYCIHSLESPEGCGRADFCRNCVVRNSVTIAFEGRQVIRSRMRMDLVRDEDNASIYMLVTASPFVYDEKRYVLLILEDISEIMDLKKMLPVITSYSIHYTKLYETVSYDPERNTSVVDVTIKTGRFHQIRRHFDMIGFPVMGDPRYGTGNKNSSGMKLEAVSLEFRCPFGRQQVRFSRYRITSYNVCYTKLLRSCFGCR